MKRVPGVALAEVWETMNTLQRYKIIDRIVQMEKELESLTFPAYGSLFLRDSIPNEVHHFPLPEALDPAKLFCIGPSCDRSVWNESFDVSQPMMDVGPWSSLTEFGLSITRRKLNVVASSQAEIERQLSLFDECQSVNEYRHLLEKASSILPILSHHPRVFEVSNPVLWHTDLHLGNIFVSPDDPTKIEGIIDWQSSGVSPLFLQARFPDFLEPPKGYKPGTEVPSLPEDFDELSPEQQEEAGRINELACRSKYYEMLTLGSNKRVYGALELDRRLWEPFTRCALSYGSMVPLRSWLIRISQDWAALGLPATCPFMLTKEELAKHDEQVVRYQDTLDLWDLAKNQLCTDATGWVPMERWEATNEMNRYLFDMFIDTMSEELSPEAASKKWPFPVLLSK